MDRSPDKVHSTPRTDAAEITPKESTLGRVHASFARQLERELAEANVELMRYRDDEADRDYRSEQRTHSSTAERPIAWRFRERLCGGHGEPTSNWGGWRHVGVKPQGPESDIFQIEPLYSAPVSATRENEALRLIASFKPRPEDSIHGPRLRCQQCGHAWVVSTKEPEHHGDHCAYVIALNAADDGTKA